MGTDVDWVRIRRRFPAVERSTYLNTAAGAPLSRAAAEAGRRYYELTLGDGDVHWDAWLDDVERIRARIASLLGVASRQVAFLGNASAGVNLVARMWRDRGGEVIAMRDEFPSCTLPWLQLGYQVRFAIPRGDGSFGVDELEAVRTPACRTVVASHVQYLSGFRVDLAELGAYCREHDLRLIVDATQSFGAFPVDMGGPDSSARPVESARAEAPGRGYVDALVFSGYKWATAGYGVSVLALAEGQLEPGSFPAVGWRSANDPYGMRNDRLDIAASAAALEQGHPPFPGIFALGAALELVEEVGIAAIADRILGLVDHLAAGLDRLGVAVLSPTERRSRSGIVLFAAPDPVEAVRRLREERIHASSRGAGVRVSLHHYNDIADVDRLLAALPAALGETEATDG